MVQYYKRLFAEASSFWLKVNEFLCSFFVLFTIYVC